MVLINTYRKKSEITQSCPTLCYPMDCSLPGSSVHPWDFPDKSPGVGCHFLLRREFKRKEERLGKLQIVENHVFGSYCQEVSKLSHFFCRNFPKSLEIFWLTPL